MSQPELHDKIRAEVERRLAVARAASQARDASTPNGEHWRWECSNCDTTVEINDVVLLDEFLECPGCASCGLALRSVEQYPTASVGELPHFVVNSAEEIRPVDGLFITVHDPADAIRRYEYALKVLDRHRAGPIWSGGEIRHRCEFGSWPCEDVADLATSLGIEVPS